MKAVIAVILTSFAVTGCANLQDVATAVIPPSEALPPQTLKDFAATAKTHTLWQVETSSSSSESFLHLTPVIVEHTVFVAGGNSASAWDKTTGNKRWQTPLDVGVSAGVSSGEGNVYLGTNNGQAVALDQQTGQIRWHSRLSSQVLAISPAREGMVVFRTNDGRLHGLSTQNGEVLWTQARPAKSVALSGAGTPIIVGSMVIAGFDSGVVTAFDLHTGNALWEATLAIAQGTGDMSRMTDVDGKLSTVGEALFAASFNGQIAGINMRSGAIAWSAPYSSYTGVEADNNGLYTCNAEGDVWKLDPRTGTPLWKQAELERRQPTTPTLQGNYLVVGDTDGYLHWLNTSNGALAARLRGDSAGYTSAPVVDGNTLYTFGRSGLLFAISVE